MKKIMPIIVILLLIILLTACQPEKVNVEVGTRTECEKCGQITQNNTQTVEVLKEDAYRYSVRVEKTICKECELADFNDPQKVAQMFFEALSNRDMEKALKYCDTSITDDAGFKWQYMSFSPIEICSILAPKISSTNWKISKIFRIQNKEGMYFIIFDSNTAKNQQKYDIKGFGLGMHQIGNKWLIFRTLWIQDLTDLHSLL